MRTVLNHSGLTTRLWLVARADAPRFVGLEKGRLGRDGKRKTKVTQKSKGRNKALVVRTMNHSKSEWPAHDSTDASRLVGC
jgi:hypothetical protein